MQDSNGNGAESKNGTTGEEFAAEVVEKVDGTVVEEAGEEAAKTAAETTDEKTGANSKQLNKSLTRERFLRLMPEWADCKDIAISVLKGGITNILYRVQSEKGDIAVRIYGNKTELFIDRDSEADAIEKMARFDISPKLVKYLPGEKTTIVDFIAGGYTLSNSDFLRKDLITKAAETIRKIHESGASFKRVFNPLKEIEAMYGILKNTLKNGGIISGASYPEFDIERTVVRLKKLYKIIDIPENKYTSCHNDLLADNFILNPSGCIQLIDWEYAGMAPKYYDIADMFQEILIPANIERIFVEYYCDGHDPDKNLRMIDLFRPFPDIFWFLWSMIQNKISMIDFDFYSYGKTKYFNALHNLEYLKEIYGIVV